MSISVGDVLRVVATFAYTDGDLVQNVFNAVIGGTGGPFDDGDIIADAATWLNSIYTQVAGQLTSTAAGSQIQVYVYDSVDDDWDEVATAAFTRPLTGGGDAYTRGVAALVNAKTTDPDVSGKKYIGMLSESLIDGAGLIAAFQTTMANLADEWVGTFTGGTSGASWVPGVWSPTRTNFYAFNGEAILPVEPAYQRRRKRGVGI